MKHLPLQWPDHVVSVFAAVAAVMRSNRLYPEDLARLPSGMGSIVPGHSVLVEHVPGRTLGSRKGRYQITINGPRLNGRWTFSSGELEWLALHATGWSDGF